MCVLASVYVSKLIGPRQKLWINAIQRRVGLTSSMLSSMKSVKMLGYSNILFNILQTKRVEELDISKNFRLMSVWRMIICKCNFSFRCVSSLTQNRSVHSRKCRSIRCLCPFCYSFENARNCSFDNGRNILFFQHNYVGYYPSF